MQNYGWVITKDYLNEPLIDVSNVYGGNMTDKIKSMLDIANNGKSAKGALFFLYDDDENRYFSGRLYFDGYDENIEPSEIAISAPLIEFGAGIGCTAIKYRAHSDWNIG